MAGKLPVAEIDGVRYTVDDRLKQLRNEQHPASDVIRFRTMEDFIAFVSRLKFVSGYQELDQHGNWIPSRDTRRFSYCPPPTADNG